MTRDEMKPEFTAYEIKQFLRSKYPAPNWVFFDELRLGTGYGKNVEQRIDAWAMHTWPSKRFLKIAFEIKVHRSDFLKELKAPHKRDAAMYVSNQFYFVAPRNLMSTDEIPQECGYMEILSSGIVKISKVAPIRKAVEPTWSFFAMLARRTQTEKTNKEAAIRAEEEKQ